MEMGFCRWGYFFGNGLFILSPPSHHSATSSYLVRGGLCILLPLLLPSNKNVWVYGEKPDPEVRSFSTVRQPSSFWLRGWSITSSFLRKKSGGSALFLVGLLLAQGICSLMTGSKCVCYFLWYISLQNSWPNSNIHMLALLCGYR